MAKRAAEKQLNDRNWQDTEDNEVVQEGPMTKAAPQVIEKRQIKSLPKKPAAAAPAASTVPPASVFGGESSAPRNPFASLNPMASSSPFNFAGQSPSSNASSPFSTTPAPTTASSPFGNNSSSSLFGAKNPGSTSSSPFGPRQTIAGANNGAAPSFTFGTASSTPASKPSTQVLTTYYASLRGLNLSAVSALERVINADGFMNLDQVFDRLRLSYNKQRELIVKDFEANAGIPADKVSTTTDRQLQSTSNAAAPTVNTTSSAELNASSQLEPSQSGTNRSTTSLEAGKDNSATNNLKGGSRPGAFATAAPARPSPLRFETERDVSEPLECAAVTEASTNIKSSSNDSISSGSVFRTTAVNLNKPAPPIFGFTPSGKTDFAPGTSSVPAAANALGPLFGSSSVPTTTPFVSFTPPINPSASNTTPAKPVFDFGRGKAGSPGSAGSSFGGFGASPKLSETTPPKTGLNPVGFTFGATMSPPVSSFSSPAAPAEEPVPLPESATNAVVLPSDEPLSGPDFAVDKNEEGEDTLFETSGRVYAYLDKTQEDGTIAKQWVGWAVCTVKLNHNQNTQKTRLLARSKTNTNVLVNFNIYERMKVDVNGTTVKFMGFENSTPRSYMIRLASLALAESFAKAIEDALKVL